MNIAHRIAEKARLLPEKKSVVFGKDFLTFREFEERSNRMARYFLSRGIGRGTRTLLFVKPCLDFSVITFALFKIGAVPVLIDPGMGVKNLLRSIAQVKPEALISIGAVHWIRRLIPGPFRSVKIKISLDEVGGRTDFLYRNLRDYSTEFSPVEVAKDEFAAILFTSGGTGTPKGVEYTHGILNAQTEILQELFHLTHEDSDLPGFPLFALFTLAMGMTSVIPDMDPTSPATCDPKKIVKNILEHQVSFVAGSPAIWERVGRYCQKNNIQLGCVKYVVMFGAPVRSEIHALFQNVLTVGDTYTPYGATESLPVTLIRGSEVQRETRRLTDEGKGVCIGHPVPGAEVKIIEISDIPIGRLSELPRGSVGEIVVSGPMVTPSYFSMEEETRKAKYFDGQRLWHRMGDLGYLDDRGRLWFLGRKAHRVGDFYPIEIEAIFNLHPEVRRSALVSFGEAPGLVIERRDGMMLMTPEFLSELKSLGEKNPKARMVKDFWVSRKFPVDVRHNIKIDRARLSAWVNEGSTCRRNLSRRWPASST